MSALRHTLAEALGFLLALYALYWVVAVIDPHVYRVVFLLITLVLTFVASPSTRLPRSLDAVLVAAAVVALAWPLADIEGFVNRAATPGPIDEALGLLTIVCVLEATRRTTGWILPVTALSFLVYAVVGPALDRVGLSLVAHRGYGPDRLVGSIYMTLEGLFGVPLDVASTYIILFTIFGAVLDRSGAGRFFVDWTTSAVGRSGRGAGAGRTVATAGYLLGAVSGSGVANTVMLSTVTWPLMRTAGYRPEMGGAILAAAGIGAILAPPVMGAAAFLIAEFLNISYLQVIATAAIPAALYYLSLFLMVEADARRLGLRPIDADLPGLAVLTRRGWYHFVSLASILVLLLRGFTTFRAVSLAIVLAVVLSFLDRSCALGPRRLAGALAAGGCGVLPVAATTATAGIIVGVVTLTGLGFKVATLIVALAGGQLLLTVVYAGLAVWLLGLAVPVTASYIIAAVMVVPALVQLGVTDIAAHMFVFYYAVLSEVSPPTALSPFAAAAITGGRPLRTTMLSWKYTAPAFVVPLAFTLNPTGPGLLLQAPVSTVVWSTATAALGIVALGIAAGGWLRSRASSAERLAAGLAAALILFAPRTVPLLAGLALLTVVAILHWKREIPDP